MTNITVSRQVERAFNRRVAEVMLTKLVGPLLRRIRRIGGRAYGNAAYKLNHGVPQTQKHKYADFTVNGALARSLAFEVQRLIAASKLPDPPVQPVADNGVETPEERKVVLTDE